MASQEFLESRSQHAREAVMCRICWTTLEGTVRKSGPLPREVAFFRAREEGQGRLRLACWVEPIEADEDSSFRRQ